MKNTKNFCLFFLAYFIIWNNEIINNRTSIVPIKGYWIRKIARNDIENIMLNRRLRIEGKSFIQSVDYKEERFFIPNDSISYKRTLSNILNKEQNFYNKQVFFIPSEETKLYANKYCNVDIAIKPIHNLYEGEKYYYLITEKNANDQYLYNITYFEGEAFHCSVENTATNKRYLGLLYHIDKYLSHFSCFFIFKATKVENSPDLQAQNIYFYN